MTDIDRDALPQVLIDLAQEAHYAGDGDSWVVDTKPYVERILALAEPVAFTRDRVRTELAASLPADPKWATWVDGVLDRLEATS